MFKSKEFDRLFRQEFSDLVTNLIWQNDDGDYEVFDHYKIIKETVGYSVLCSATEVGFFSTAKTALCWCIADKYKAYNLARDLHDADIKLTALTNDITARIGLANRSSDPNRREIIETKLESKIIKKKKLEEQLTKYVSWAKYCQQQRGFNNETVRTGRIQAKQTSR